MESHNVMEDVVRDTILTYQKSLNLTCECERCLNDVMSLALNDLPPRYISIAQHSPYIRATHEADRQGVTNIIAVITKAASRVSSNPRCETYAAKQKH